MSKFAVDEEFILVNAATKTTVHCWDDSPPGQEVHGYEININVDPGWADNQIWKVSNVTEYNGIEWYNVTVRTTNFNLELSDASAPDGTSPVAAEADDEEETQQWAFLPVPGQSGSGIQTYVIANHAAYKNDGGLHVLEMTDGDSSNGASIGVSRLNGDMGSDSTQVWMLIQVGYEE